MKSLKDKEVKISGYDYLIDYISYNGKIPDEYELIHAKGMFIIKDVKEAVLQFENLLDTLRRKVNIDDIDVKDIDSYIKDYKEIFGDFEDDL